MALLCEANSANADGITLPSTHQVAGSNPARSTNSLWAGSSVVEQDISHRPLSPGLIARAGFHESFAVNADGITSAKCQTSRRSLVTALDPVRAWRSLVACRTWNAEVAGSIPAALTKFERRVPGDLSCHSLSEWRENHSCERPVRIRNSDRFALRSVLGECLWDYIW